MAWNKPSETKVEVKNGGGQRNVYLKGLIVGAVAVLVGVVCIFAFSGKSEKPVEKSEKTGGLIKEVTPASAPILAAEEKDARPTNRWFKYQGNMGVPTYVDSNGVERYRGGARVYRPDMKMRPTLKKTTRAMFQNHAENQIYALVSTEPGTTVFGTRKFDQKFRDSFMQSVVDKTIINDDDPPEVKQAKELVIEAKKELVERLKNGEDVCEIMKESFEELQRMASQKRMIEQELIRMRREGEFDEGEAEAIIAKVNENLAAKGISPISKGFLLKKNLHNKFNQINKGATK